jgi:hypothetical protein
VSPYRGIGVSQWNNLARGRGKSDKQSRVASLMAGRPSSDKFIAPCFYQKQHHEHQGDILKTSKRHHWVPQGYLRALLKYQSIDGKEERQ